MKAVLVFCEGRHDIVFAQRSLGTHRDCTWVDKLMSELPSPFGSSLTAKKGLIARRIEQHAVGDRSLLDVSHPPLPSFESIVENVASRTIFFLIRTHGQDRSESVLKLLEDLHTAITEVPVGVFEVSEYAAAFLFDANGAGVNSTLAAFSNRYREYFGDLSDLRHGAWMVETNVPVGCFVFHRDAEDQTGTIENHLAPMVKEAWPERYASAECFIDGNKGDVDEVSKREAERLKAIITVTGQFDHPGDPMSIIIGRGGLPPEQFERSELSRELASFLVSAPWTDKRSISW